MVYHWLCVTRGCEEGGKGGRIGNVSGRSFSGRAMRTRLKFQRYRTCLRYVEKGNCVNMRYGAKYLK